MRSIHWLEAKGTWDNAKQRYFSRLDEDPIAFASSVHFINLIDKINSKRLDEVLFANVVWFDHLLISPCPRDDKHISPSMILVNGHGPEGRFDVIYRAAREIIPSSKKGASNFLLQVKDVVCIAPQDVFGIVERFAERMLGIAPSKLLDTDIDNLPYHILSSEVTHALMDFKTAILANVSDKYERETICREMDRLTQYLLSKDCSGFVISEFLDDLSIFDPHFRGFGAGGVIEAKRLALRSALGPDLERRFAQGEME